MKRLNLITLGAMMLMASCSELTDWQQKNMAPEPDTDPDAPLTVTASSATAPVTRATDGLYTALTGFDGTEQVKIWMDYGTTSKSAVYGVGSPFVDDGLKKSALTLNSGESTIYYPSGPSGSVTLYGLYPSGSTATHTVGHDQTADDSYKASDLMYATIPVSWTTMEEKYALRPNLPFKHQMTKLKVTIVKYEDVWQVQGVTLNSVKRTVSVSPTTTGAGLGTVSSATDGQGDEIIIGGTETKSTVAEYKTYTYACVFPAQTWADGDEAASFITVRADDCTAVYKLKKTFQAGYEYTLTINLNALALDNTVTIDDWGDATDCVVNPTTTSGGTLKIAAVGDQMYTGNPITITPAPAVTHRDKNTGALSTLTEDTDYDLQYYNNTNAGQATILAVGKTGTDYEGQIGIGSFYIVQSDLALASIADLGPYTYKREAWEPELTVVSNGKTLVKGVDYTVSFSNNVNAGTATATITAVVEGNFTGTNSKTFTINPKSLTTASGDFTITLNPTSKTYNGSKQSVSVSSVTDRNGSTTATMTAGTDYTVIGTESTSADVGTYTVTVTGKGNYTGTKTATWTIDKTAASVTTAPTAKTLTYNGSAQALVNAGTASGGTMYYCMTTTNVTPNVSNLTSTSIPTETNAGTYYVWYYVKGDANHTDTDVLGPVTVTIQKKTVTDWSISPTTMSLSTTGTKTGTITVNYGSGSSSDHGTVSWSSNATGIATVSNGTVTAVAGGSATISVSIAEGSNYTYSGSNMCNVTVQSGHERGDIVDDGNNIKVYTSATGGYKISKSNTQSSVSWSNNASWGTKGQWEDIFKAVSKNESYTGGYSALNTAVSNAGISGWTNMSGYYWSCTERSSSRAWYFGADGWDYYYLKSFKFYVRSVSAFND